MICFERGGYECNFVRREGGMDRIERVVVGNWMMGGELDCYIFLQKTRSRRVLLIRIFALSVFEYWWRKIKISISIGEMECLKIHLFSTKKDGVSILGTIGKEKTF